MKRTFNKKNLPGRGPNALWLLMVIVGLGIAYLFWYNSVNKNVETINFSKLMQAVDANKVESVVIQGQHVQGKYKGGKYFEAFVVPIQALWDSLRAHNVEIDVFPVEKDTWGSFFFFFAFVAFAGMLIFYLRQNQNGGGGGGGGKIFSVGKSKAKFFSANQITVTFKDVAGNEEAKEDVKDIVDFLKNPEKFERLGAKIPRGILLTGAPGNGKTLLAKAVAGEANCPFFSISGSDFVEVFVGVGASRVRDLFTQARRHTPCIVFIDEIDAVGRQRGIGLGGGNDEREQTLNQLLAEMDGFSTEKGAVIVMAATNRPDVLDKALLRPGRFDRMVEVPFPDTKAREQILRVHSKGTKLDADVNLSKIARGTPGFSGADLENLINEAALIGSKRNHESITMEFFELARDKIMLGSERKTLMFTEKEKRMTAFHEAGHTMLNILQPETDPFHKVTIVPRGRALGVSWSLPEGDVHSQTKEQMLARMVVCYGGMLAETLFFDTKTSGCSNDIEKATKIARAMVSRYGMSDLGPITFETGQEHPYLGRDIQSSREFSEHTAQAIDQEVSKIVSFCYNKGKQLLEANREKMVILAERLIELETLQAHEVYELLGMEARETHSFHPGTHN
ncbi:ATP-dependent zinc metalloprotease FtsH [Candidatus Dependentiae bacterium]|nr:ATP-dependent zinc metalloprotease FtsH [Candidatus Dependentiae bacterium]